MMYYRICNCSLCFPTCKQYLLYAKAEIKLELTKHADHIRVSDTFFDTTRITSVAIAFGCCLSRDVATTGNRYSTKYVLDQTHTYSYIALSVTDDLSPASQNLAL